MLIYGITLYIIISASNHKLLLFLLLSLSGLPPFAGFFLKTYILHDLILGGYFAILFVFLVGSLLLTANYISFVELTISRLPLAKYISPPRLNVQKHLSFLTTLVLAWSII